MKSLHILVISLILIIIFLTSVSIISFGQNKSIEELYFQGVNLLSRIKLQTPVWRCSGSSKGSSSFFACSQKKPAAPAGGVSLDNEKKYEEALTYFQQVIELDPGRADAHFQIGKIFRNTNQFEKAIIYFKNAIKIKPDYSSAYYELGLSYIGLQKKEEALEAFKQAVRSNPDFASRSLWPGMGLYQLKDYEKAIEAFKQVMRIQPDYTFAHYSLGMIYLVQGDKNAALDEYKILKDLDQDTADQLFDMIYK